LSKSLSSLFDFSGYPISALLYPINCNPLFSKGIAQQLSLFQEEQRKTDMVRAMDEINDRFGDFSVTFGSLLTNEEKGSHVISPAWRPDEIRNVDVQ